MSTRLVSAKELSLYGYYEKSYEDLRINEVKEYGILNAWHDYCTEKGFFLYKTNH